MAIRTVSLQIAPWLLTGDTTPYFAEWPYLESDAKALYSTLRVLQSGTGTRVHTDGTYEMTHTISYSFETTYTRVEGTGSPAFGDYTPDAPGSVLGEPQITSVSTDALGTDECRMRLARAVQDGTTPSRWYYSPLYQGLAFELGDSSEDVEVNVGTWDEDDDGTPDSGTLTDYLDWVTPLEFIIAAGAPSSGQRAIVDRWGRPATSTNEFDIPDLYIDISGWSDSTWRDLTGTYSQTGTDEDIAGYWNTSNSVVHTLEWEIS